MLPTPGLGDHDGPRTPPPPPRRSRRRGTLLAAGATALAALVAVWSLLRTDGTPAAAAVPWPDEGQAAVLIEGLGERGDLGAHGPERPVPIASVTKVMTAYVILRDHPLHGTESGPLVPVDQQAVNESFSGDESTVEVRPGQRLSQRRLLELMLIPSGNNIARLLARWDAGSQKAFVARMNSAAADLGMHRTTYTGASGIEPTTTSTAADQLKLARQVMRDKVFRSIVAQPHTTAPGASGTVPNTNDLLDAPGVVGIKTGSSTPAGGALMWAVNVRDRSGQQRLALGVVLHQHARTTPREGLQAALDTSRALVEEVRARAATTAPATSATTSDAPPEST
ncbi:D-alanyl-D-alanine carboxypeptidase family protein [Streptomyces sp. enrichment culture]|uniref:D-alanyl-D-alanine carboxypeptidase family protein n=1 Tax=Streptomyces sp. enrichment culture TaxID=1795815 RepID=UPI003F56B8D5